MLHPNTELRYLGPEIGSGVIATAPIPKGTITWVQDELDQVIDVKGNPTFQAYPAVLERYSFRNKDGFYVLCWDYARFVNHHCEANCLSPGLDFEIAIRDIEAGEELPNVYGSLNLEFTMECMCGSLHCRKRTEPEDFPRLAEGWDRSLRAAFPFIAKVEQPLWGYLESPDFVKECLEGRAPIPSIGEHMVEEIRQPREQSYVR